MEGRTPRAERLVCILCPGGLEHSGGIGRVMGYIVDSWAHDPSGPASTVVDTRGTSHIVLAPIQFARALATIGVLAARGRVRLLHVNLSSHGSTVRKALVMALAGALRLRSVVHLHGSRFDVFYRGLPSIGSRVVRWMFLRADRVVVLGQYWRDFVVTEIGVPDARVETVFNGVPDPGPPPDDHLRSAPERARDPHILFLGRLGERKGVPELLAALEILAAEGRWWHATLAGDGPVEEYRNKVRLAGLQERVTLPGWVDRSQVDDLLRDADIVVLPSHQENQPISVIEGLAHRVAVVTTLVGSLPDILQDEETALTVAPGDVPGLSGALRRLLEDPLLRSRIAGKGHEIFSKRLDVRIAAARLSRIYDEIDQGGAPPS